MKRNNLKTYRLLLIFAAFSITGCSIDEKLDTKSDIRITQAETLEDYQMLLDGIGGYSTILPSYNFVGECMTDNILLTDQGYTSLSSNKVAQNIYTWNKELFAPTNSLTEWDGHYNIVLNANVVIDGLKSIPVTPVNKSDWDRIQGSALFIRALTFLNIAEYWAPVYKESTAAADLGIVLRLSSDVTQKSVRSSVKDSYSQIISDLTQAIELLPNNSSSNTPLSKVRPSKAAAYGLLARVYLDMGDYANVKKNADSALALYSSLMDYNEVISSTGSIQNYNKEMVYDAGNTNSYTAGSSYNYFIDAALVQSYEADDLRNPNYMLFFYDNGQGYVFIGDYTQYQGFSGIANDEVYLMRAEANARLNNPTAAMNDLNTLLVNRYVTGTFTDRTALNADDALTQVLTERRKELVSRGRRWADLKRLNLDPRFAKNLTRTVLGQAYSLPANDSRYALQIPPYIITLNGIQQNP